MPRHYTLELGSGVSTTAFENAREHLAIEVDRNQSGQFCCAQSVPPANGRCDWQRTRRYGVILVDVPFQGNQLAGIDMITAVASSDAVIFVDDTNRKADRQIADEHQ